MIFSTNGFVNNDGWLEQLVKGFMDGQAHIKIRIVILLTDNSGAFIENFV